MLQEHLSKAHFQKTLNEAIVIEQAQAEVWLYQFFRDADAWLSLLRSPLILYIKVVENVLES